MVAPADAAIEGIESCYICNIMVLIPAKPLSHKAGAVRPGDEILELAWRKI